MMMKRKEGGMKKKDGPGMDDDLQSTMIMLKNNHYIIRLSMIYKKRLKFNHHT